MPMNREETGGQSRPNSAMTFQGQFNHMMGRQAGLLFQHHRRASEEADRKVPSQRSSASARVAAVTHTRWRDDKKLAEPAAAKKYRQAFPGSFGGPGWQGLPSLYSSRCVLRSQAN